RGIERLRRAAVAAKGLLDDHASTACAAGPRQLVGDEPEQRGRNGEVVRGPLGGAELLANGLERTRIVVVAIDVAQQAAQRAERRRIEPSVLLDAILGASLELFEVPA